MIERHERRPAARAFECPQSTFHVRVIGGGRKVLLGHIAPPPAPEPLSNTVRLRFGENAARRFKVAHSQSALHVIDEAPHQEHDKGPRGEQNQGVSTPFSEFPNRWRYQTKHKVPSKVARLDRKAAILDRPN